MNTLPLPRQFGKVDAVLELGNRASIPMADKWNVGRASEILTKVRAALSPSRNEQIVVSSADELGLKWMPIHSATTRNLTPMIFTNGRPECFGGQDRFTAFSPEFKVLSVRNGYIAHCFGAALVMASDDNSIVRDVSSRYSRLCQYYDFDASTMLKDAPFIDGTVIPIADDIRPLNFCHWLVDWLPRLGFLGAGAYKPSVYVVTTPLIARFQIDSLKMCGFDESRVIALEDFRAVRARELLVPSDLRDIPHPIHKGAPWALSWLRATVGMASIMQINENVRRHEKLYVSRADAPRRKVVNDADLAAALAKFGYRSIELSGMSLAEQATRFAYASHIVSLHGAGLSNLAFAAPGTKVIEIFPERYGTPAFAVIAASLECPYATYIADKTVAATTTNYDDVVVDVTRFLELCGHLI
jgi:capsular polysaccharide biosynthesis protein